VVVAYFWVDYLVQERCSFTNSKPTDGLDFFSYPSLLHFSSTLPFFSGMPCFATLFLFPPVPSFPFSFIHHKGARDDFLFEIGQESTTAKGNLFLSH